MRFFIVVIAVISVIALAATIGAIVIGSESFEGIVVDKPYEAGLAWDATHQNHANLGWTIAVAGAPFKIGKDDVIVTVLDKKHALIRDAVVAVTISRPSTRAYDRTFQTSPLSDGRYHATVALPLLGNWDLNIEVNDKSDRTSFHETIYAESEVK